MLAASIAEFLYFSLNSSMFFWQLQVLALVYIHRLAATCPPISVLLGAATNSFSPSSVQLPVLSVTTMAKKEFGFRLDSVVDVSYITNVRRQELFHYFLSLLVFLRPFWAIGEFLEVHSSAFRSRGRWGSLPIRRLQNMECRTFLSESLGCGNTRLLVSYATRRRTQERATSTSHNHHLLVHRAASHLLRCKICGPEQEPTWAKHGPTSRSRILFCARNLRTYVVRVMKHRRNKHAMTHSGEIPRGTKMFMLNVMNIIGVCSGNENHAGFVTFWST